jgi:hypothetical protein
VKASKTKLSRLAYSIASLSRATDLSRSMLYEQIRNHRLVARKCDNRTIVLRSDALAWLQSLPVSHPESAGSAKATDRPPVHGVGESTVTK